MRSLLLVLLAAGAAAQDDKPCDLAKTELREYCAVCKAWPAADRIDKNFCLTCKGRVEKLETCIKFYWDCPTAHDGKPRRHAKACGLTPTCCREKPSLALVWLQCDACSGRALKDADFRHTRDKCEGKPGKTCAESGRFPHGGIED